MLKWFVGAHIDGATGLAEVARWMCFAPEVVAPTKGGGENEDLLAA
ncbi:hypothetical protein TPR58_14305 [Sphingomonas sp. HF-S3]|uniref:Uncharacterized protein n=1 Tax=Sphingomonas rustica TaxID=3103142 RepID=A0ABV0B9U6_9SPHN